MNRVKPRWSVIYRDGRWRVMDRGQWSCTFDSLREAHTWATQNAVADVLYRDGGLTCLTELLELDDRRQARTP